MHILYQIYIVHCAHVLCLSSSSSTLSFECLRYCIRWWPRRRVHSKHRYTYIHCWRPLTKHTQARTAPSKVQCYFCVIMKVCPRPSARCDAMLRRNIHNTRTFVFARISPKTVSAVSAFAFVLRASSSRDLACTFGVPVPAVPTATVPRHAGHMFYCFAISYKYAVCERFANPYGY